MPKDLLKALVAERKELTPELMILKLKPERSFSFLPGQYCTIGVDALPKAPRPYSIVSAPHEPYLELFIELVPEEKGGVLTPHLWKLRPGDFVRLYPKAKGVFVLRPEYRFHMMIATVTGIAPYVSILRHYNSHGGAQGDYEFLLLQGASYQNEFGYFDELRALSDRFEHIHYVPTVSRPGHPFNGGWRGSIGRADEIAEAVMHAFGVRSTGTLVSACGNPDMIKNAEARLASQGYAFAEEKFFDTKKPTRKPEAG